MSDSQKIQKMRDRLKRLHRSSPELPQFRHHRLEAYTASQLVAKLAIELNNTLPAGTGKTADQLRRAARSLPLLLAEGCYRRSAAQKRQRFDDALGETGECAAAAEMVYNQNLGDPELAIELIWAADHLAKLLTGLCKKFS